jgi:hypothetical protein
MRKVRLNRLMIIILSIGLSFLLMIQNTLAQTCHLTYVIIDRPITPFDHYFIQEMIEMEQAFEWAFNEAYYYEDF